MDNRSITLKKGLSLLLSIFLILPLFTTTAYATSIGEIKDNGTQGSNTNSDTVSGGTGFLTVHQGYRVSILSGTNPFPGVAKPVQDIWYSTPPSDIDKYMTANRLGMDSDRSQIILINQGDLKDLDIPKSIETDGNALIANGIAVKEYLLNGTTSGGTGGGSGGSGPTINWNGGGSTRSSLAEKWDLDTGREAHVRGVSKYYIDKLRTYYMKYSDGKITFGSLTPDEFRERMFKYADKYADEVRARYSNDHDLGMYSTLECDAVVEAIYTQNNAFINAYVSKYNRVMNKNNTTATGSRVAGAYYKEDSTIQTFDNTDLKLYQIPLAGEESGGSGGGQVPLTQLILALFADGTDAGEQALADAINADDNFKIVMETIVWHYPHRLIKKADGTYTGTSLGIKVAGTAKNIAEFNSASASLIGDTQGGYMANLTNKALPKGLMTERDDTVLNILMPTDPGEDVKVATPAIMSNYGWGVHIYDKNSAGTHTYDRDTYPDGTPGPAPDPGTPGNPSDPSDPENPASPEDPSNPSNPNGSYNITIIKFYESNNVPESNFTREHNPGTIAVEDEPIYHLVDWFYSPDRIDPPSQSTAYDDTKVQALVTGDGTTEATVNVVTPDTTLYLKLVKQDKAPANPTQQFILKESEVTKAYNSQQVQAGASWPTGDIFHWAGDSLGSGKCTAIIGYTCDCDDDDCSGCVQLTFPCSTDIIQKRN